MILTKPQAYQILQAVVFLKLAGSIIDINISDDSILVWQEGTDGDGTIYVEHIPASWRVTRETYKSWEDFRVAYDA
jgi:hypothetical protein